MRKIKIVFLITRFKNAGPINQTYNLIKYLDKSKFQASIISLFSEVDGDSIIEKFSDLDIDIKTINSTQKDLYFNGKRKLLKKLSSIEPHVIHSVGMAPYKISKHYEKSEHVVTIRNYVFDDYPAKYGKLLGSILAKFDMRTITKGGNMVTCSNSLSDIYKNKQSIDLPFIRNGVDSTKYRKTSSDNKKMLRKELNLAEDKKVAVYTGQFSPRKNQEFAISGILSSDYSEKLILVLLGVGKDYGSLREKYKNNSNIRFVGQTTDVEKYLQAADFYISSSKSEGMPNGVLEAMSAGLPILLSDILQHKEVFEISSEIGVLYKSGDIQDFKKSLKQLLQLDLKKTGIKSEEVVTSYLNAELMSKSYQEYYNEILSLNRK